MTININKNMWNYDRKNKWPTERLKKHSISNNERQSSEAWTPDRLQLSRLTPKHIQKSKDLKKYYTRPQTNGDVRQGEKVLTFVLGRSLKR